MPGEPVRIKPSGFMPRAKSPGSAAAPQNGQASHLRAAIARDLRPDTLCRVLEALKNQWKRYRKCLKKCQQEFSEPAVHNSRVETRRLLSMLELLGPFLGPARLKKARAALKRHLDTFDDLRDTHVQLILVGQYKDRFPGLTPFAQYLTRREKRFTRKTRKNIKRIKTKRLGKLLTAWHREIGKSYAEGTSRNTHAMLQNGMQVAFNRTVELKAKIDPAETTTIHRTRVAFKRFRYMIEVVTGLFPGPHKQLLCSLHDYQTLMGVIQDAEVLLQTFEKFLTKQNELEPETGARFSRELLERRRQLVDKFLGGADQLFAFDPGPQAAPGGGKPKPGSKTASRSDSRQAPASDANL